MSNHKNMTAEQSEQNTYPHKGEVWYVGVDRYGRNVSDLPMNLAHGDWTFHEDAKVPYVADSEDDFLPQLEGLDVSTLTSPEDGQLKVEILGKSAYRVERYKQQNNEQ